MTEAGMLTYSHDGKDYAARLIEVDGLTWIWLGHFENLRAAETAELPRNPYDLPDPGSLEGKNDE